jgi:hypothetical protein
MERTYPEQHFILVGGEIRRSRTFSFLGHRLNLENRSCELIVEKYDSAVSNAKTFKLLRTICLITTMINNIISSNGGGLIGVLSSTGSSSLSIVVVGGRQRKLA